MFAAFTFLINNTIYSVVFKTFLVITCEEVEAPSNGGMSPKKNLWLFRDTVKYSCAKGFRMVGNEKAKCQEDSLWSSPPPVCEGIKVIGIKCCC